jgi:hypothetical protein
MVGYERVDPIESGEMRFIGRQKESATSASIPESAPGLAHLATPGFQEEVAAFSEKWDREWVRYFFQHNDHNYFRSYASNTHTFPTSRDEISRFSSHDSLTRRLDPDHGHTTLQVYVPGAAIVGRDVFEMGSGVGMLGRILGHVARSYVGFDYSPLALQIGRITSSRRCTYVHAGDMAAIAGLYDSADTCLSRHFFIHNNFENATWVLQMLRDIVRDDGLIHADFFNATEEAHRVFKAKSPLLDDAASCGFFYTDDEIFELADICDLTLESIDRVDTPPRVYVNFRRRNPRS